MILSPEERVDVAAQITALEGDGLESFDVRSEDNAARYFVRWFGDLFRYCSAAGGFLIWDGRRYALDCDGSIMRLASECTDRILRLSERFDDLKERKRWLDYVSALRRRRGLENVAQLAATKFPVAVGDVESFDANPWAFNVRNGTIDLRTGELRPHLRGDMLTKLAEVDYDPAATAPRWSQFLDEIFSGDEEVISFVQRAAGYSLTGSTQEQVFFVAYGAGANGKTTLLSVLATITGEYGLNTTSETFVDRRAGAATNDLARLQGARFVTSMETSEGRPLAENFVKAVTGGDRITARYHFKEFFEFSPAFKLWFGTNHKPIIKGADDGIWRRVRLIPFERRFEGADCDPDLRAKLDAELPGILAWAVRGCLEWQERGLGSPAAVATATAAYRTEMDVFADFIDERCVLNADASTRASQIFAAYRSWAEAAGEKPLSQRWFGLRLNERGFRKQRTATGVFWAGIGLQNVP